MAHSGFAVAEEIAGTWAVTPIDSLGKKRESVIRDGLGSSKATYFDARSRKRPTPLLWSATRYPAYLVKSMDLQTVQGLAHEGTAQTGRGNPRYSVPGSVTRSLGV